MDNVPSAHVDQNGHLRKRIRRLPRSKWAVLIRDHHQSFINWETYEMNQSRIAKNTHPAPHQSAGAIREGSALLQGIATCGRCGRRLRVYYQGKHSTPGYYCAANNIVNGRGMFCLRVGGLRIDQAVAHAFLDAVAPAGIEAALVAEKNIEAGHEADTAQWRLQVERSRYEAERAERRYRSVEPENRLVARTLEAQWESRLSELAAAEAELVRRQSQRPAALTDEQRMRIRALGTDLRRVWEAHTTTDRNRKELLQTLLEEVIIAVAPAEFKAHLTLRWRGGAISELDLSLRSYRIPPIRTDEAIIDLVCRLAVHYPDGVIAGILNRQGRRTANGDRFTANKVGNLRRYWQIPRFDPSTVSSEGELVTIQRAAEILGVVPSTVHRWLAVGFIAGEQITPGAPWRIRINNEMLARFVQQVPEGHVSMLEATKLLGVSRQTVLQRVKRGELTAAHVRSGKRNGLYIKVLGIQATLFDNLS